FFAMIELVRYLYTQFHLWAFVLSAFAFIALWFTQPRLALKREMQERVAQDLH
ncbi:multidrug transporter MdfA, partial [Acinetobacter baumannii]|nr:multidrug transporter MdfA [Acinetobacter baumannii]EKU1729838.1 multidrug transporter MdfA [Acinetobacter baumannii]EKV2310929.1 multidrug transporter MdfA [Acinetobacter baumannii]EKV2431465.1 multidrug transporter MdfA [Acinetobacter baumannii]EKV2435781.1 multidrug transporter MdfA [Acinetobacter baumannii]